MSRTLRALLTTTAAALAALLAACGEDGAAASAPVADHPSHVAHVAATDASGAAGHGQQAVAHSAHDHHAGHQPALPAGPLPGASLFHLASAWTDQDGGAFALPDLRGRPSVFVMFYGDCTTACPLLVKAAEDIEAALPAAVREEVEFVMVTFATAADTPAKLKDYAAGKGLDRAGWRWLVGSPLQTRQLATMLGVQYRDVGNGMFAHSNVVTVLDRDGHAVARLEGLGVDPEPAVAALVAATE